MKPHVASRASKVTSNLKSVNAKISEKLKKAGSLLPPNFLIAQQFLKDLRKGEIDAPLGGAGGAASYEESSNLAQSTHDLAVKILDTEGCPFWTTLLFIRPKQARNQRRPGTPRNLAHDLTVSRFWLCVPSTMSNQIRRGSSNTSSSG